MFWKSLLRWKDYSADVFLTDFQMETFGAFKVEGCIEIGDATEEVSK